MTSLIRRLTLSLAPLLVAGRAFAGGLSPVEAVKRMRVPDGLEVRLP